jgi:hypothetical protein
VEKTRIPITYERFPATKNPTQNLHEENATKENEGEIMEDTHDHGGDTTRSVDGKDKDHTDIPIEGVTDPKDPK